jgi:hypothetical protein
MQDRIGDTREELLVLLRCLSDDELVARLKGLAARERRATALLVAHLAELDTRDVYLRAGYSSLFTYCRDVLALSDGEAYNRIEAARAARRFPLILDLLASGEISLTGVRLLAPHLTAENHLDVLESARGKRKAEIEEIVARLSPGPDVPARVRKLPEPRPVVSSASAGAGAGVPPAGTLPGPASVALAVRGGSVASGTVPVAVEEQSAIPDPMAGAVRGPLAQPRSSAEVRPLSPDRYGYQLSIGGATLEKLRLAKDMLRHAVPSGDDEAVLDRALDALLADLARKKFGAAPMDGSPAAAKTASTDLAAGSARVAGPDSRDVAVAVKRAVWVRDLGRCAFVGTGGHRCDGRAFLEFHHVRPYAVGGRATVDNIELRCGRHNRYEACRYFAREDLMDGKPGAGTDAPTRTAIAARGASRACSGTSLICGGPATCVSASIVAAS